MRICLKCGILKSKPVKFGISNTAHFYEHQEYYIAKGNIIEGIEAKE